MCLGDQLFKALRFDVQPVGRVFRDLAAWGSSSSGVVGVAALSDGDGALEGVRALDAGALQFAGFALDVGVDEAEPQVCVWRLGAV